MFTSVRPSRNKENKESGCSGNRGSHGSRELKIALGYLTASIILAAAGAVYEHFSFGVYSNWMIYAFAFPLIGGTLPHMLSGMKGDGSRHVMFAVMESWMYHAAVATLTVGSVMQGILAICGRPNSLTAVYPAAAAVLIAAAAGNVLLKRRKTETAAQAATVQAASGHSEP